MYVSSLNPEASRVPSRWRFLECPWLCACLYPVLLPSTDIILIGRHLFVKTTSQCQSSGGDRYPPHLDLLWSSYDLWVVVYGVHHRNHESLVGEASQQGLVLLSSIPLQLLQGNSMSAGGGVSLQPCQGSSGWAAPSLGGLTPPLRPRNPVLASSLKWWQQFFNVGGKACLTHVDDSCGRGRYTYRGKITP